jgi:hypothetical protein
MSEQKNNTNNRVLQSRIRKYDTYRGRKIIFPRSSLDDGNKTFAQVDSVQTQPKDTKVNHSESIRKDSFKITTDSILRGNNLQKTSSRDRTYNKPPQPLNGDRVALQSVANSQLYENETYPDNGNTVYGTVNRKKTLLQKFTYGFALVVLIFSAFVSTQSFITNNRAQDQIASLGENITRDEQGVSEGSGNEPSEEPIPESVVRNYQVSNPEDPRFLRIPALGVFSRIKNLGVTPEGAVDAPRNIFDTGWYSGSARPGSSFGSSLILGHVSGWTGPGVFKKINELPVGGEFEIEKGTGEIIKYSVTRYEQIPLDQIDMGKILSTEIAGRHDLKLMTCSGRYNSSTETFEDRFIVYAKKI